MRTKAEEAATHGHKPQALQNCAITNVSYCSVCNRTEFVPESACLCRLSAVDRTCCAYRGDLRQDGPSGRAPSTALQTALLSFPTFGVREAMLTQLTASSIMPQRKHAKAQNNCLRVPGLCAAQDALDMRLLFRFASKQGHVNKRRHKDRDASM